MSLLPWAFLALCVGALMAVDAQKTNINDLLYLFDRPSEPIFLVKDNGRNQKAVFDVPNDFLSERQQKLGTRISSRFGEDANAKRIPVRKISLDLSVPRQLGKRDAFSLFLPQHRAMAARLINIFMGMRDLDEFISAAAYARAHCNYYMFMYAYSVAMLHRKDTQNAQLPSISELFPEKYVDGSIFAQAREEAITVTDTSQRIPLEIPKDYTATDREEEHRVAYFREDLGINLHHWHWHLVYPFDGPMEIVRKDRRGELFYYMHQQIMARYNFERFSNHLARVKRLTNLREPIPEAYFPKLDSLVASRSWPARVANTRLSDINREAELIQFDIQTLERWRDRIMEVVNTGVLVTADGQRRQLTEATGIDDLGNMIESSILSPNRALYGDLHNFGHVAIAYSHDPDHRHLEPFGVMGDSTTAMRDPVFYRWHSHVDEIFQSHKKTLPPYRENQLSFPGIRITSVEVSTPGSRNKNELQTFWQQSDMDLSRGLDFVPRGPLFVRFTHLQHRSFTYTINVENTGSGQKEGYVRIFLAPKNEEGGRPMLFNEQRSFMVELDKFVFRFTGKNNKIEWSSTRSSVSIPFERTFRNLDLNRPANGSALEEFNFCGCGWPQHMLIPKGSAEGLQSQLFVMITDYSQDFVEQPLDGMCNDAASYCGVRGQKYPDKRAMGFPFDRPARPGIDTLRQFLTPNMFVKDVTIKFTDRIEAPSTPPAAVAPARRG